MTEEHAIFPGGEVVVYQASDGEDRIDVRLEREAVWLSLTQMAELFGRDKSAISRHLRNVFDSGELEREATVAKNVTVQTEDGREVAREIEFYNLDAILSVGYRVNSKGGTQFRIWATRTLRDHPLRGYTLHERRLAERGRSEAEQAVALLARTMTSHALVEDEGQVVLDVVQRYTRAWRLLLEYDEERLAERPAQPAAPTAALKLADARAAAERLREELAGRGEAGALFGQERGDALAPNPRRRRADLRRRASLPERPGTGGAPPVLSDQGPALTWCAPVAELRSPAPLWPLCPTCFWR